MRSCGGGTRFYFTDIEKQQRHAYDDMMMFVSQRRQGGFEDFTAIGSSESRCVLTSGALSEEARCSGNDNDDDDDDVDDDNDGSGCNLGYVYFQCVSCCITMTYIHDLAWLRSRTCAQGLCVYGENDGSFFCFVKRHHENMQPQTLLFCCWASERY